MNRSSSTRVPPGPPMPLGLPPPRTPPPIHTAPSPTSPLSTSKPADTAREDIQETMWWHEWLCGCSEGPERGGNYQVRVDLVCISFVTQICMYVVRPHESI